MQKWIDIIFGICKIYIDSLFATFNSIPQGTIVMWSGIVGDVPAGWYQCNGNFGTPDLRNRFILANGPGIAPHDIGGSEHHTHPPGGGSGAGKDISNVGLNVPPYYVLVFIMKL